MGFEVEHVRRLDQLRGQPDEILFQYAVSKKSIIVTRDLNFANIVRFELYKLPGIVVLRFPNDIPLKVMCQEIKRLASGFKEDNWHNIVILTPGSARLRRLGK